MLFETAATTLPAERHLPGPTDVLHVDCTMTFPCVSTRHMVRSDALSLTNLGPQEWGTNRPWQERSLIGQVENRRGEAPCPGGYSNARTESQVQNVGYLDLTFESWSNSDALNLSFLRGHAPSLMKPDHLSRTGGSTVMSFGPISSKDASTIRWCGGRSSVMIR